MHPVPVCIAPRAMSCIAAALLIASASGPAFGWSASGTVKSTTGTALSGVQITLKDSSTVLGTTDAAGSFSISGTTGLVLEPKPNSAWQAKVQGTELQIRSPFAGVLDLSLVDNAGRTHWIAKVVAQDGNARVTMPSGLSTGAAYLVVRHPDGEFVQPITLGTNGARIASHLVASRTLAGEPILKFKKSGFADTTFAMTSLSMTGIAVAMRDTTSSVITCPSPKLSAGDQNKTITVKGVSRKFILHVPSGYTGTTPVPMLVDFHPIGGSAQGQSGGTLYKTQADKDGAISVYPDGLTGPMGQAWNVKGCCTTADDTAFARALIGEVKKVACIDPKRVYAAGFSMGGGMTHFAACHLSDIIAAAAPAAFDLLKENVDICKPVRPITMVMFRGTNDGVVNYAGGYSAVVSGMPINFLGAKATQDKWAELNKCTGSASAADANGCTTYSNCEGGVQVTLCTKQGGGHDQGNGAVGWPILKKYTLP